MKLANEIKDIHLFHNCFDSLTNLRGLSFILKMVAEGFAKTAKL
jgi:hypothetical protein